MDPNDLESWRIFFSSSGFDIFVVINKAIMVASKYYSLHFKLRREQIISQLYQNDCPCSQPDRFIPVETKIFPQNADGKNTVYKSCCNKEGHQDQKRILMEQDRSFIIKGNDENKLVENTNIVEGSNKNTEAFYGEGKNQTVEHQGQLLMLEPVINSAINQIGVSNKLASQAVSNSNDNNFLENLNKNSDDDVRCGLINNAAIKVSNDSIKLSFNGTSNGTDGVIQNLNKNFSCDRSVGSLKLGYNGASDDKIGDYNEGVKKGIAESSHINDRGLNSNQIARFPLEQVQPWNNLIHEGDDFYQEVLYIKSILEDCQNQPDMVILELLTKLRKMDCTVEILKATMIGKAVSFFRKYDKKEIRDVARSLISEWRKKALEWHAREAGEVEVHPSTEDELPCPVFNEATTFPTADELELMFNGLDEKDFFSLLPPEDAKELFFPKEQDFPEIEQFQIDVNSDSKEDINLNPLQLKETCFQENRNDSTESAKEKNHKQRSLQFKELSGSQQYMNDTSERLRERNLNQNPLQLKRATNCQEDNGPMAEKYNLDRYGRIVRVTGGDCVSKPGKYFPSQELPKVNEVRKSEVMKRSGVSTSTLKHGEPPKDKNNGDSGRRTDKSSCFTVQQCKPTDEVNIPQGDDSKKMEETRKKLREGYAKAHDAKRHCIQMLDVNSHLKNTKHKRQKRGSTRHGS